MGKLACVRLSAKTRALWAGRVEAWRASGETAVQFAQGKGFEASTLRFYSSLLSRAEPPRLLQLVRKSEAAGALEVQGRASVVVEVGAARVRVEAGFDGALLAEVVRALSGGGR